MKFDPGKCLKCGAMTIENGALRTNHTDAVFNLSNGAKFFVGVCADCEIDPSEYPQVMQALKEYQVRVGVSATEDMPVITSQSARQTMVDILKAVQNWRCAKCGKELGETYVQTNGKLQHESCKMPEKDRFALLAEIEALKAENAQLKGV